MANVDRRWHPLDERYVERYGSRHEGDAREADESPASGPRCPLCLAELVFTHRRRGGFRYYRHLDNAADARCPLTTPSYEPPGLAVAAPLDEPAGLAHRERFLQHWQRHYRLARQAAPPLTLERFARLIEYADVVGLWRYPAFDERDAPYVLLALAGFLSVHEPDSRARIRLWFDGSVRDVGDLLSETRATPAKLFKLTYHEPLHTPFPTSSDILFWEPVERFDRLADCTAPRLRQTQVRAFNRFLDSYERERATRDA